MARYRAKAMIYIDRLITPGEVFSSDLPPGRNWEPLDDAAKAKSAAQPVASVPSIIPPDKPLAAIPAEWRELRPKQIIALAQRLGAPAKGTTVEIATAWIDREIAQRGQVSQERSLEAAA